MDEIPVVLKWTCPLCGASNQELDDSAKLTTAELSVQCCACGVDTALYYERFIARRIHKIVVERPRA